MVGGLLLRTSKKALLQVRVFLVWYWRPVHPSLSLLEIAKKVLVAGIAALSRILCTYLSILLAKNEWETATTASKFENFVQCEQLCPKRTVQAIPLKYVPRIVQHMAAGILFGRRR